LRTVAKPELGTKRLCAGCGAKFYDLSKTPPVCPACGTVFEIVQVVSRSRPEAARAVPVAPRVPVVEVPEPAEVETISLEEADAEAAGKKPAAAEGDVEAVEEVDAGEEIEDGDEEPFIEEQEEEDTDVTEIIGGDIENEEET
jgi:uncharacterized protein (TIGR02300 family)